MSDGGVYYITGEIDDGDLTWLNEELLLKNMVPDWNDDIQLIINSPGGLLREGWPLIDLMDWISMDIRTVGIGEVCSLAVMLVAAGTPGMRMVTPNTSIMVHGFSGSAEGNYNDICATMKGLKDEQRRVLNFWKKHSKYKTDKDIRENLLKGTDIWLTPAEAVEHGIIDGIAGRVDVSREDDDSTKDDESNS